jgi:hypothetical protein
VSERKQVKRGRRGEVWTVSRDEIKLLSKHAITQQQKIARQSQQQKAGKVKKEQQQKEEEQEEEEQEEEQDIATNSTVPQAVRSSKRLSSQPAEACLGICENCSKVFTSQETLRHHTENRLCHFATNNSVITATQPMKIAGKWSYAEHMLFEEGVQLYNDDWQMVAAHIKTRTASQARSHFQKWEKKRREGGQLATFDGGVVASFAAPSLPADNVEGGIPGQDQRTLLSSVGPWLLAVGSLVKEVNGRLPSAARTSNGSNAARTSNITRPTLAIEHTRGASTAHQTSVKHLLQRQFPRATTSTLEEWTNGSTSDSMQVNGTRLDSNKVVIECLSLTAVCAEHTKVS